MQWSDLKGVVGDGLQALGNALAGKAGGKVGQLIAKTLGCDPTPDAVSQAIKADPQALEKLAALDNQLQLAEIQADSQTIQQVNQTMRTEAQSEHWAQWLWRPFNGFLFGITIFCVYVVLPIWGKPVPTISADTWMMWGGVLGVAAWHRGVRKRLMAGDTSISQALLQRLTGKSS